MNARRTRPRAIRFADIKVGDQLMRRFITYDGRASVWYYIVTDLWFDPCAGQTDETAGRMVAVTLLDPRTGEPRFGKQPHTVRGLASQGFFYSDVDFAALARTTSQALTDGQVIGIGRGHVIRRRPKVPQDRF